MGLKFNFSKCNQQKTTTNTYEGMYKLKRYGQLGKQQ